MSIAYSTRKNGSDVTWSNDYAILHSNWWTIACQSFECISNTYLFIYSITSLRCIVDFSSNWHVNWLSTECICVCLSIWCVLHWECVMKDLTRQHKSFRSTKHLKHEQILPLESNALASNKTQLDKQRLHLVSEMMNWMTNTTSHIWMCNEWT